MDCKNTNRVELAEKYVRNDLAASELDEYETHLIECAECVRQLELLQILQAELEGRAHEIRAWTPSRRPLFGWRTLAIAALVIIAVAGTALFQQKKANGPAAKLPAQNPPQDKELSVQSAGEAPKGNAPNPDLRQREGPDSSHRNIPLEIPKHSEVSAPELAVANAEPKGAVAPPEAALAANQQPNTPNDSHSGASNPQPARGPNDTKSGPALTTAQGVEIYYLGSVVAPPFTFTGFHSSSASGPGPFSLHSSSSQTVDTSRKVFREAMAAYVEGNYQEAGESLQQAAEKEPAALDVQFYLGVCQILNGQPQAAIHPLRQASSIKAPALQQEAHYYLAKAYLQSMQFEEAEAEFRIAAELTGPLKGDSAAVLLRLRALRAQIGKN
ncbi:MAG TPA: tetratricopeptide repeat protein [Candidatus Sulfotelmatobacter sp.]|jgi:tetratricopeptide (TPR) repeat protein|nr:tetratricopeptide repeat protein [Candidatus Sulfotelmatobacter sp.]